MELRLDIDVPATAKNTRLFLERDFQHYIQLAGIHRADLKSPTLSFTPTGMSFENTTEKKMIGSIEAADAVDCIVAAIKNCSSSPNRPSQQILTLCYLSEVDNWKIAKMLGYESSQYHRLKRTALCEFADRLDYWKKNSSSLDYQICINLNRRFMAILW